MIDGTLQRQEGVLYLAGPVRKRLGWEQAGENQQCRVTEMRAENKHISDEIVATLATVATEVHRREGNVRTRKEALSYASSAVLQQAQKVFDTAGSHEGELLQMREAQIQEYMKLQSRASHSDATETAMLAREETIEHQAAQMALFQGQLREEQQRRNESLDMFQRSFHSKESQGKSNTAR